jgi:hypothetical protein
MNMNGDALLQESRGMLLALNQRELDLPIFQHGLPRGAVEPASGFAVRKLVDTVLSRTPTTHERGNSR